MSAAPPRRWLDPRVALGVAVTALALWWAFRSVPLAELWTTLRAADLWLVLLPSAACYWASLWLRVLRWRHLAAGIGALPLGAGYRATAIRFMANNLLPLRVGELAGALVVARDVGGSAAAWFGTIVLERAFDSAAIMALAILLVAERIELGALRFAAFAPLAGILALRLWPALWLRLGRGVAGAFLPARLAARAAGLLEGLVAGLAGIRGWGGLASTLGYTALLWGALLPLPFLLTLRSLAISPAGEPGEFLLSLTLMVGVAVAVALPQAPGFVGVYHLACVAILGAFDVAETRALALGTIAHASFWVSITAFGLLALRQGRSSLADALRQDAEAQ
jgi:hypothetical protein